MYSINSEDGTLNKDGKMCYCVYTESSCTSSCAAFEERAKDRVMLCCVGREIIAKPTVKDLDWAKPAPAVVEDPLGLVPAAASVARAKKARRTK